VAACRVEWERGGGVEEGWWEMTGGWAVLMGVERVEGGGCGHLRYRWLYFGAVLEREADRLAMEELVMFLLGQS
jgi:hypothetical protein